MSVVRSERLTRPCPARTASTSPVGWTKERKDERDRRNSRVHERHGGSRQPRVTRVDEPVSTAGQAGRSADERRHVRVAADDPIEGDEVGRVDGFRDRHEVARDVTDPIGMALPLGLATGGREIRSRRVDVDGCRGPCAQQLMVDGTDAATDVEDGPALETVSRQAVDQGTGQAPRPISLVVPKMLRGVAGIELAIVVGLLGSAAVHRADPSRTRPAGAPPPPSPGGGSRPRPRGPGW